MKNNYLFLTIFLFTVSCTFFYLHAAEDNLPQSVLVSHDSAMLITLAQHLRSDIGRWLGLEVITHVQNTVSHDVLIDVIEKDLKHEIYQKLLLEVNGFTGDNVSQYMQLSSSEKEHVAELIKAIHRLHQDMR